MLNVCLMNPLNCFPLVRGRFEPVADVNAPDHENVSFELDLPHGIRRELIIARIDLARFQRTSQCPRKSPGLRGYNFATQTTPGTAA